MFMLCILCLLWHFNVVKTWKLNCDHESNIAKASLLTGKTLAESSYMLRLKKEAGETEPEVKS